MSAVEIPPGRSAAGCAGCLEVFSSVSAFSKHQTLGDTGSICHNPAERGLVLREVERAGEIWSLWGWPDPEIDGKPRWFEKGTAAEPGEKVS